MTLFILENIIFVCWGPAAEKGCRLVADRHFLVTTDLDVGKALAAARGWSTSCPRDPDSDDDWFVTDWMDTTRAQQALGFQRHRWPDMLDEMRAATGWRRHPMRLVSPIVRRFLKTRAAYPNSPGRCADPWGVIGAKLGEPRPDRA